MQGEQDPFTDSRVLLKMAVDFFVGLMLDPEHSALGEQVGVGRMWVVQEIGEGDVMQHCEKALLGLSELVEEASSLWGAELDASFDMPVGYSVLLESDVNPELPKKWGWVQDEI